MKALVVHNSDEVKAVFIGFSESEIFEKLKVSKYWEDISSRTEDYWSEWDEENRGGFDESKIAFDDVTSLYHDGDSIDGYTILEAL